MRTTGTTMRWLKIGIATAALAAAVGPSALAANAAATPDTLEALLARVRPGDTVTLAPGEYRNIRIAKRKFDPAVTLDATQATIVGLHLIDSEGFNVRGGEFRLPPPVPNPRTGAPVYGSALRLDRSSHISIKGGHFVGPGHPDTGDGVVYGEGFGVLVGGGTGFVVEDSSFTGFASSVVFNKVDDFRVSNVTSTAM